MADWVFPGIEYDFKFHFGGAKVEFDFKFTLGWLIGNFWKWPNGFFREGSST